MEAVKTEATREEIEASRKVVAGFLFLRKNYSLYPEDHSICINTFEQFQGQIEKFLRTYESLKLEVQKDRLLFHGEVIHIDEMEEGTISFTLFRDGIRWVEFRSGIEQSEIKKFLRILQDYKTLPDEPEGDLVTALWEARLPHIKYDVADISWAAESEMDFTPSHDTEGDGDDSFFEEESLGILSEVTIGREVLKLTPEEEEKILEFVRIEEKRNSTSDYLDALFDSLLEDRERENFEIILDVLEEELRDLLSRRDFDLTLRILQSLHYVLESSSANSRWAVPVMEDFFLTASSPHSLLPLQSAWTDATPEEAEKIRDIFLLLRPEAIHTLGPILLHTSSLRKQHILMDVMTKMASEDICPLESLLATASEEELIRKIVKVLGNLEGKKPLQLLKKLTGHHFAKVRYDASKGLLARDSESIKELFSLIDEESESLHGLILAQLAASKNSIAEELLLDYLEKENYRRTDDDHIIACFRTLGQCGSARSVPFLRRMLFRCGWMPRFWKASHRKGAAIALSESETDEARTALEDASRSWYPTVRRTARRAIEGTLQ